MSQDSPKQQVKVSYKETSALFCSQFICTSSEEDITVGFSSGPITDSATGEAILPVHTRIAMTLDGARRLHATLGRLLNQQEQTIANKAQAQLPKIKH